MSLHHSLLACAASLLALAAAAADAPADELQRRERLAAERVAVQARYDAAARECEKAFAVTGCMNRAKSERRSALDRIAREELSLDDAQRRRRADERRHRIAQKQQAAASRAAASAPDLRLRAPRQPALAASAPRPSRRAEPRTPQAEAAEAAEARRRSEQAQKRRERAASRELAVRQRDEQERASGKVPAAPLPAPQGSVPVR